MEVFTKRLIIIDMCILWEHPAQYAIEIWAETGKIGIIQELLSKKYLLVGRRRGLGADLLKARHNQKAKETLPLNIERHMFITKK